MKYIVLLRGVNVGKHCWIEMKKLKSLFETIGFTNVSTYINSGNVLFESPLQKDEILKLADTAIKREFNLVIPILVKTRAEMKKIADAIPETWSNNPEQRTDVAYLFPEADSAAIIGDLPLNRDAVDIRYVKGALLLNIKRENYTQSGLNKIIGCKAYKNLTIRNVNTARILAG